MAASAKMQVFLAWDLRPWEQLSGSDAGAALGKSSYVGWRLWDQILAFHCQSREDVRYSL